MNPLICPVCPHACRLGPGEIGLCGARQAQESTVAPLNYGRCTALALDPIEKKPLARYYPGSMILSYGSFGCNLACAFCQNWQIAQAGKGDGGAREGEGMSRYLSPEELVSQAVEAQNAGNIGVALTYNEPLICPEYILDLAERLHAQGLKLVLVTNRYVMPQIAEQVFRHVDAANIDLKAFRQEFYTSVGAPAGLSVVKRNIEIALASPCHVEVTTLIIPGLNDEPQAMREEVEWLASLDAGIPLHLSRFHPAFHMCDTRPTPRDTMYGFKEIACQHLSHVFLGNI